MTAWARRTSLFLLGLLATSRSGSAAQDHLLSLTLRPFPPRALTWLAIRNATDKPQSLCIVESAIEIVADDSLVAFPPSEPQSPHGNQCNLDLSSWRLILPGETAFFLRGDRVPATYRASSGRMKASVFVFLDMDDFLRGQLHSELLKAEVMLPER